MRLSIPLILIVWVGACLVAMPTNAAAQATQQSGAVVVQSAAGLPTAGPGSGRRAGPSDALPIPASTDATPGGGPTTDQAFATPASSIGFDLGRMAIALALVLLLILLARWLLTHFFAASRAPATSRAVRVLGRTSLAPRQQVLLLQVGRRVVVVGESNGNLATLAQLEDPDEVAQLIGQLQEEQIARAASFGGMFGRVQKKFEEDHAARGTSDSSEREDDAAAAPDAQQMKSELSGLVEKVRSIRSQLRP